MPIRALAIDDERHNLDNLTRLVRSYCPQVEMIDTAMSAEEARPKILSHLPDLIFLDIQMPAQNGFDLIRTLPPLDMDVIFVTAFDEYAIQAIRFAAVDYLLKPVHPEELQQAVHRVLLKRQQQRSNEQLQHLLELLHSQQEEHRLALPTAREIRLIRTTDIVRCESLNNYTAFYLASREKIIVSKPIYEYEEMLLPYRFIRCHQSHLVNLRHVKSWIREEGGYLLLDNGDQVPVSRSKKEQLLDALKNFGRRG